VSLAAYGSEQVIVEANFILVKNSAQPEFKSLPDFALKSGYYNRLIVTPYHSASLVFG
jgi:hypothetical protein